MIGYFVKLVFSIFRNSLKNTLENRLTDILSTLIRTRELGQYYPAHFVPCTLYLGQSFSKISRDFFQMAIRVRGWCFTINNAPNDYRLTFLAEKMVYCVYQWEVGTLGHTPHIQGYLELKNATRMPSVKVLLGSQTVHLEVRRGTRDQARNYCMKEDTRLPGGPELAGPFEFGEWKAVAQGERNDLNAVKEALDAGNSMKSISQNFFPQFVRNERGFKRYMAINAPPTFEKHPITDYSLDPKDLDKPAFFHGPSGIAKTGYALAHFQNPFLVSNLDDLQNLDTDHDGLVFDDMCFTDLRPEAVIHLLDIENTRSIHNRFQNAIIPRGMKRIFTHNLPLELVFFSQFISSSQVEAIKRRLNVYELTHCLIKPTF